MGSTVSFEHYFRINLFTSILKHFAGLKKYINYKTLQYINHFNPAGTGKMVAWNGGNFSDGPFSQCDGHTDTNVNKMLKKQVAKTTRVLLHKLILPESKLPNLDEH